MRTWITLAARTQYCNGWAPIYMHTIDAPIARAGGGFRPLAAAPGVLNHLLTFVMVGRIKSVDPLTVNQVIEHQMVLPIGGGLQVIHAPGHCAGQIALLWQNRGVLFAADTCMNLRGPRWSIAYEDFDQGRIDLQRMAKLQFDVACFGHGDPILENASSVFRQRFGQS